MQCFLLCPRVLTTFLLPKLVKAVSKQADHILSGDAFTLYYGDVYGQDNALTVAQEPTQEPSMTPTVSTAPLRNPIEEGSIYAIFCSRREAKALFVVFCMMYNIDQASEDGRGGVSDGVLVSGLVNGNISVSAGSKRKHCSIRL